MFAKTRPAAFAHHYHRRHPYSRRVRFNHRIGFPPGTMPPGAVPKAYGYPDNLGTPRKTTIYGIVSLGGTVLLADVQAFCTAAGYPLPNLTVLLVVGATRVSDPGGADTENQLDVQRIIEAWNRAYPGVPASIFVGMAPNVGTGIQQATTALRQAGCNPISCSWGAPKASWGAFDLVATESEYATCQAAGVILTAASGDNSVDDGTNGPAEDYPSCSVYVWACGGTTLTLAADGSIAAEKAWGDGNPADDGGGGGYDPTTPQPAWQKGVVPGNYRGTPDSSVNADPNTGYQTADGGSWDVIGGTSASAPSQAGLFGVLLSQGADPANYQAWLYAAQKTAFHDITTGSNGDPATTSWDPATGLGSIDGPGFAAALSGSAVTPVQPPTNPPSPQPVSPAPTSPPMNRPTLGTILKWIESTVAALGQAAIPLIASYLATLGLPAFELAIVDAVLGKIGKGASVPATFRLHTHDTVTPPNFAALLTAVQNDVGPVQQAQASAAALPGLQTQLQTDYAALTAALQPLLPVTPAA